MAFQPSFSRAQDVSRTIHKTAAFVDQADPHNKFSIMNINGSVSVEAYDGTTIQLTVAETIKGSAQKITQAEEELTYKLERRGNHILAYLDAPFVTVKIKGRDVSYSIQRADEDYEFNHDVRVKVPRDILLNGSTINGGMLKVVGPFKEVKASNINGGLDLQQLTSLTEASTVNGDIDISYARAPKESCSYKTVNGTIDIHMPNDLSADVYFKSLHGDLYTDFEVEKLKPEVRKQDDSHATAIQYRVDKFSPVRIGAGGPKLTFNVLNGDVYLRKD
ncbi:DUF4097 family beta strand repeat-containing protein [Fodinibius salsisoli]|uniref:DUF4097 domain-containing protein n=1 Tax=Fodinibius salsisoli TaxID=2820877 RepID=A0ABT3PR57_9BACT|nr:hypothetical protein [Fodinibius salsisoli]MCW9708348.1 hypothetical protein [Fodinibius salsisoli]